MPFACFKDNKYCISTSAAEAFEGRGSFCSRIPHNMKDVRLITSFNPTTGEVVYRQVTEK